MTCIKNITKLFSSLGTINIISLNTDELLIKDKFDNIETMINDYDDKWSVFKYNSLISQINKNKKVKIDEKTKDIISKSFKYSQDTNGYFDITSYPLNSLWKDVIKYNYNITEKDIKEALKKVNYKNIRLKNNILTLKNGGIDLCGIAKGYILKEVVSLLKPYSIASGTISLGGSIYAYNNIVGIRNPFTPIKKNIKDNYILKMKICDEYVITSGTYEQEIIIDNKKYNHIINPKTGYPTTSDIKSVTLVGYNPAMLDAYATAFLIMDIKESIDIINKNQLGAIFIFDDGKIFINDLIKPKIVKEEENEKKE